MVTFRGLPDQLSPSGCRWPLFCRYSGVFGFEITNRDDPAAGSFVSRDPMPGLNRFAYGGGNPVGNVDLSGMCYEQSAYNKIASEKSPVG